LAVLEAGIVFGGVGVSVKSQKLLIEIDVAW